RSTGCVDRRDSLGGCPDFLTAHLLISVRSRQFAYLLRTSTDNTPPARVKINPGVLDTAPGRDYPEPRSASDARNLKRR
ncbi:MAG: hypothetical protein ACYS74_21445, partial [Planctomycetota bacterium]